MGHVSDTRPFYHLARDHHLGWAQPRVGCAASGLDEPQGRAGAPDMDHDDGAAKRDKALYFGVLAEMAALERRVGNMSVPGGRRGRDAATGCAFPRRTWRGLRSVIPWRRSRAEDCRASGWRLHAGCADADGRAVCPLCSQSVGTVSGRLAGRVVRVIEQHRVGLP